MDTPVHSFPLPAPEAGKLEAVAENLRRQPAYAKAKTFTGANPWPFVLLAFAVGLFTGKLIR